MSSLNQDLIGRKEALEIHRTLSRMKAHILCVGLLCILARAGIVNLTPTTTVFVPDGDGLVLTGPAPFFTQTLQKSESETEMQRIDDSSSHRTLPSSHRTLPASRMRFQSVPHVQSRLVLRFCGIDCPEHGQRDMARAQQFVRMQLTMHSWTLDRLGLDVHGRTLVTLRNASGNSLATLLVEEGYCVIYPRFLARCPLEEQRALRIAQEHALHRFKSKSKSHVSFKSKSQTSVSSLAHRTMRFGTRYVARQGVADALRAELLRSQDLRSRPRPRPRQGGVARDIQEDVHGGFQDECNECLPWAFRRRVELRTGIGFFASMFH